MREKICLFICYASVISMIIFIILDLINHKQWYVYVIIGSAGTSVGILLQQTM